MLFELLAVVIAGVGAAGIAIGLNRLTGRRLPRWVTPVAAGLTMLGVTVFNEYGWYARAQAALPEGTVVVHPVENRAMYRPWTYVWPYVDRFVAQDRANTQALMGSAAIKEVPLYLYDRWTTPKSVMILVNCETGERAEPGETNAKPVWQQVPADDAIVTTACKGGA
ncbi:hypothetical protein [Pseudoprimorskyibacter insulae]|uniref:Uncharacterized protein n=1 Tax=Pseudoprimorskyibacter insulae TaxID=1695997 RepID=A0A2R8AR64_9RHOB|nr:hypothetical protein [Pseudoprimorskyibacter insulae]SPF78515.1 hypothetical protein PRI8871_01120 [Pseudoprimorskyibacter insulae]